MYILVPKLPRLLMQRSVDASAESPGGIGLLRTRGTTQVPGRLARSDQKPNLL